MNNKEKNFSNALKKHFIENKFFVDKIESRLTTAGIPDLCVLSPNGNQSLVELKVIEKDNILKLTPGQIAWHSKRVSRGLDLPFVVLYEPLNKMLIMTSNVALGIAVNERGKFNPDLVNEKCWFTRDAQGYLLLSYATTDAFKISPQVYNISSLWYNKKCDE